MNNLVNCDSLVKCVNGNVKARDLKINDIVYSLNEEIGLVHDKIVKISLKNERCYDVYVWGNKCSKIVKPNLFDVGNYIFVSSSCCLNDVNDFIVVGYFLGDGWLSSGYCGGIRKIKRCNVSFGVHPKSDDLWIFEYINSKSSNKVNVREKFIRSSQVPNGGNSKKIEVTDRVFWEFLFDNGCPVGKKNGKISCGKMSESESKDFLTGLYSAEGCVYLGKTPSIQIGINWKECIDYVDLLLNEFGIFHTYHISGKTYKIYISRLNDIVKCFSIFDFRLDSRKQAKYNSLIASVDFSIDLHNERQKHIDKIRELRDGGMTLKYLLKMNPFSFQMLKKDYKSRMIFKYLNIQNCDFGCYIPTKNVVDIGEKEIVSIETESKCKVIVDGFIYKEK